MYIHVYTTNTDMHTYRYTHIHTHTHTHTHFFHGSTAPRGSRSSHLSNFEITLRHTTFGRIPVDE
jgi:hypothetical protein